MLSENTALRIKSHVDENINSNVTKLVLWLHT